MRYSIAPAALAALAAANPMPQGVTAAISPSASAPAGCSPDYSGEFQIQVVNVTQSSKRSLNQRQENDQASGALILKLAGGILTDSQGRTGYIAANRQFQFDKPAQTGAIYTAGWSACSNGTLAIGGDAVFDQCLSGTFYNLYDEATSAQCSPVYIEIINSQSSSSQTAPASQLSDGQVTATPAAPVSQISDGQIQATTGSPVQQISDGQIQAQTTGAPVTQISDGQIQAPTSTPVSPITQISDGQVQAPTGTGSPVSQISDGQIQAPTNGSSVAAATSSPQPYTGAASHMRAELFGLAAGILAVAML